MSWQQLLDQVFDWNHSICSFGGKASGGGVRSSHCVVVRDSVSVLSQPPQKIYAKVQERRFFLWKMGSRRNTASRPDLYPPQGIQQLYGQRTGPSWSVDAATFTYGHELLWITESPKLLTPPAKISFLCRLAGCFHILWEAQSFARRSLGVSWGASDICFRSPMDTCLGKCPRHVTVEGAQGRSRTSWRGFWMVWQQARILPELLEEVSGWGKSGHLCLDCCLHEANMLLYIYILRDII